MRCERELSMLPLNPDYEEMRIVFNEGQIRNIQETRRNLEAQLKVRNWQYYKSCIDYECSIIAQIKGAGKLAEPVLTKVFLRIQGLFKQALETLHTPFVCYEYFKFCEKERNTMGIADMITLIMREHEKFPFSEDELFIAAAECYWTTHYDLENSVNVLKDGLKLHPDSQSLYLKIIEIEMFHKEKKQDKEEVNRLAMDYLHHMMKNMKDADSYIYIIRWFQGFVYTLPVQDFLIEHVINNYNDNDSVWLLLIEREKRGFPYGTSGEKATEDEKIEKCIEKYEEGLQLLTGTREERLMKSYADFLYEYKDSKKFIDKFKEILNRASDKGYLSERYYIIWLDLSKWSEKGPILHAATKNIPTSLELWRMWLKYEITGGKKKEVLKVFNLAREVLSVIAEECPLSNIVQFWILMLNFHMIASSTEEIREFYEMAILEGANVSNIFKSKYIEWLIVSDGFENSKKLYVELWKKMPSKEMYNSMCQLQGIEAEKSVMSWWDEIHTEACKVYGNEDVDVWINYIKFYMCYSKDGMQKIDEIKSKAKDSLPHIKHKLFFESYDLLLKNVRM
ncbi:PREDICTED: uncharacterized protein LOC108565758 [Nicrophorus vespilloides]|uniref:Uncharacterized protein LOC108565758 n=1 Tax=Nicrophorus vespilloides TaxID=110193 RepID=A0ABM1N1Z8_NICVS|nr:PREDICTED: uncharacterized protein LOC108565758 [Nicrophorus vespilloides]